MVKIHWWEGMACITTKGAILIRTHINDRRRAMACIDSVWVIMEAWCTGQICCDNRRHGVIVCGIDTGRPPAQTKVTPVYIDKTGVCINVSAIRREPAAFYITVGNDGGSSLVVYWSCIPQDAVCHDHRGCKVPYPPVTISCESAVDDDRRAGVRRALTIVYPNQIVDEEAVRDDRVARGIGEDPAAMILTYIADKGAFCHCRTTAVPVGYPAAISVCPILAYVAVRNCWAAPRTVYATSKLITAACYEETFHNGVCVFTVIEGDTGSIVATVDDSIHYHIIVERIGALQGNSPAVEVYMLIIGSSRYDDNITWLYSPSEGPFIAA